MGKDLHIQNLNFFDARMTEHSAVANHVAMASDEHFIFRIDRRRGKSLKVLLTDAYSFSEAEALLLPRGMDYVVMGKPHGSYDDDVRRLLAEGRVGLGHIGKFMGAINKAKFWEYRTPEEIELDDEEGVTWPP